jgi:hypothetical protein
MDQKYIDLFEKDILAIAQSVLTGGNADAAVAKLKKDFAPLLNHPSVTSLPGHKDAMHALNKGDYTSMAIMNYIRQIKPATLSKIPNPDSVKHGGNQSAGGKPGADKQNLAPQSVGAEAPMLKPENHSHGPAVQQVGAEAPSQSGKNKCGDCKQGCDKGSCKNCNCKDKKHRKSA